MPQTPALTEPLKTPPAAPQKESSRSDGSLSRRPQARSPEIVAGSTDPSPRNDRPKLPPHRGKLARIQDSAEGVVLALREWIDLRVELVKTEIQELITEKQNLIKYGAIIGVVAALAGLMLLLTLGFAFSAIFEAVFGWAQLPSLTAGYGTVVVLLAVIALMFYRRSPLRDSS